MRSHPSTLPFAASPFLFSSLTAVSLVAALFLCTDFARAADDPSVTAGPGCTCPQSQNGKAKPKFAALPEAPLDASDEMATLESVQFALSQVADGSSYVWHRSHGRLSGVMKPTSSFKDAKGQVCRHLVVILNSLDTTKRTETIACRQKDGVWLLDG